MVLRTQKNYRNDRRALFYLSRSFLEEATEDEAVQDHILGTVAPDFGHSLLSIPNSMDFNCRRYQPRLSRRFEPIHSE